VSLSLCVLGTVGVPVPPASRIPALFGSTIRRWQASASCREGICRRAAGVASKPTVWIARTGPCVSAKLPAAGNGCVVPRSMQNGRGGTQREEGGPIRLLEFALREVLPGRISRDLRPAVASMAGNNCRRREFLRTRRRRRGGRLGRGAG